MASNTPAGRNSAPSIISANLHIVGNLKTDGEIQIDGVIEGDVTAQALTIGGSARVSGELTGQEVIVHGQISGKITSKNVRLAKTAKVVGDIWQRPRKWSVTFSTKSWRLKQAPISKGNCGESTRPPRPESQRHPTKPRNRRVQTARKKRRNNPPPDKTGVISTAWWRRLRCWRTTPRP